MPQRTTKILREDHEVGPRLLELQLDKARLLDVRMTAIGAAADATPFHPANSSGTFSYHQGTFALRNEFVGETWKPDRPNGVEAIKNETRRVRVVFANVDVACNDAHQPKARSEKGAGAARLCAGNNLFGNLPHFAKRRSISHDEWITYYLMVAPNGAVELSCATVENNDFAEFIERLYLSDGSDIEPEAKRLNDDGPTDIFDPQVARKR
ncbi:MAG: hypothetical protein QOC72_2368 [Methylobacteriaceae bacterium]|jgi:hypothetical protein|nr:hypothetical protein [Methylobacteriaceae bacterium]